MNRKFLILMVLLCLLVGGVSAAELIVNTTATNCSSINWTWTNPTDAAFNHTYIMKSNVFYANLSNTTTYSQWTGLTESTQYNISTHTVDITGNMNTTWVNASYTLPACGIAPVADFTATPLTGEAPLFVTFTDTSTNVPTEWIWEYSNATIAWTQFSTVKNPTITLPQGVYNFRMNATNAYGSNMKTRSGGYVTVTQMFPCGSNYAVYEDHWAKCVGSEHLEMWNVSGTVFLPKSGVTNVSYYIRGAGAGGNGNPLATGLGGWGGRAGYVSTGYKTVAPGSSYTVTLGDPGIGGIDGPSGTCRDSASGEASTFAGTSANGGIGGYSSGTYGTCGQIYLYQYVGLSGDPDLNYGGGGAGGTCSGFGGCCLGCGGTSVSATAGKRGFVTVTYANATPVASFTPVGERLATDIDIVTFTDTSLNAPTAWTWTYSKLGGAALIFSYAQNPSTIFSTGNYSISLNASTALAFDVSDQVTWLNVTALPENPNPGALLQFQSAQSIGNLTPRTVTIDMKNVNITNNVSMSIEFPKSNLYIQSIAQNTTVWNDIVFTHISINNSTGTLVLNVTRPGGFTSVGQPLNAASFVDISTLYWNYSTPPPVTPGFNISPIYLKNSTENLDYPVFDYAYFDLAYQDWITYSNFSVTGLTSAGIQTLFLPSENNFTANRWTWNFGDGTPIITGNASYPEPHAYAAPGTFNVSCTAYLWQNTSVSNTTYLTANITMPLDYVHADFVGSPLAGSSGLLVTFTDKSMFGSTNATSGRTYNWSFGDAGLTVSPTSNQINPSHVYSTTGTYSVTLIVNNTLGSDTEIKESYITISTSQQNTWYTPKQISVVVMSYNTSTRVVGANVTLVAIGTSLQDTGQLQTIYGVNPSAANQMVNGTLIMSSFTGGDGGTVFTVLGSIRYNAYVTDPVTGTLYTVPLNPGLDPYIIWIGTNPLTITPSPQMYMNNTRLYFEQPDAGNVTLALRYQDTSGKTSNVRFIVKAAANMTIIVDENLGNPGTGIVFGNRTYPNILGDSYFWYYNATKVT